MEMINEKELTAFLLALSAYYKVTGTLEPLATKHEDNRALTQSAN